MAEDTVEREPERSPAINSPVNPGAPSNDSTTNNGNNYKRLKGQNRSNKVGKLKKR